MDFVCHALVDAHASCVRSRQGMTDDEMKALAEYIVGLPVNRDRKGPGTVRHRLASLASRSTFPLRPCRRSAQWSWISVTNAETG
jgi:hypothetical protein